MWVPMHRSCISAVSQKLWMGQCDPAAKISGSAVKHLKCLNVNPSSDPYVDKLTSLSLFPHLQKAGYVSAYLTGWLRGLDEKMNEKHSTVPGTQEAQNWPAVAVTITTLIISTITKPGKNIGEKSSTTTYPRSLGVNAAGHIPF